MFNFNIFVSFRKKLIFLGGGRFLWIFFGGPVTFSFDNFIIIFFKSMTVIYLAGKKSEYPLGKRTWQ